MQDLEIENQSIKRDLGDIPVEVKEFMSNGRECFLRFEYENPILGELNWYAEMSCKDGSLKELNSNLGLAYYFFGF